MRADIRHEVSLPIPATPLPSLFPLCLRTALDCNLRLPESLDHVGEFKALMGSFLPSVFIHVCVHHLAYPYLIFGWASFLSGGVPSLSLRPPHLWSLPGPVASTRVGLSIGCVTCYGKQ
jgi:hypothetical protein